MAETLAERKARLDRAAHGLQRGRALAPRQVQTTPRPPRPAPLRIDPRATEPGSVVLETLAEREAYAAQVTAELRALVGDAAFRAPPSRANPWNQRERGED